MIIRNAAINDVEKIRELNEVFFHEKGRDWEKLVTKDIILVLEYDSKIIGFTGLRHERWNDTAKVIDIFIHPDHRGKGLGSKLCSKLIEQAKELKVRCLIAEAPSKNVVLHLYLKCGFRICGFNDRYYSNQPGEIALFLSYDFPG